MAKKYWLLKSEPDVFSIDDLKTKKEESWDGVRNYQARNFMRDEMKKGDLALFYHSNCKDMGVVGVATISRESHPDHTAWDKKSKYYDPKSPEESPRWFMVALKFKKKFKRTVSLAEIKEDAVLQNMRVAQRGNRLSITPVELDEFERMCELGGVSAK